MKLKSKKNHSESIDYETLSNNAEYSQFNNVKDGA